MKTIKLFTLKMLLLITANILAQYAEDNKANELCDYQRQISFSSDIDAEQAMDKILAVVRLPRFFVVQACPTINNARAITPKSDGYRYILYDPEFMRKANSSSSNWSNLSILAHEIAHHLLGHTLRITKDLKEMRKRELEADNWSGYILYELGASLYEAQSAVRVMSNDGDDSHSTHPSRCKRLAAIEKGYKGDRFQNKLLSVEKVSASPESIFVNGQKLYEQERYSEAIEKFTAAIRLNPSNELTYLYRGNSNHNLKYYERANEDYNKAIELDPLFAIAYYNRGNSKRKLEDYHGAINDYNKAIELDPLDAVVYYMRGVSKDDLEDYHGAVRDYNRAIELDPLDADAYSSRGISKENLEDYEGACLDFKKACDLGDVLGGCEYLKEECN